MYPNTLFLFTVLHFSSAVSSQLLCEFALRVVSLENSCLETSLSLHASSAGHSGHHGLPRDWEKKAPLDFSLSLVGRGSPRGACLAYSADYTSQIIYTTPQWETVFRIGFLSSIKAFLPWRLVVRPATVHIQYKLRPTYPLGCIVLHPTLNGCN